MQWVRCRFPRPFFSILKRSEDEVEKQSKTFLILSQTILSISGKVLLKIFPFFRLKMEKRNFVFLMKNHWMMFLLTLCGPEQLPLKAKWEDKVSAKENKFCWLHCGDVHRFGHRWIFVDWVRQSFDCRFWSLKVTSMNFYTTWRLKVYHFKPNLPRWPNWSTLKNRNKISWTFLL